jgi:hypothetical protein
LALGRQERSTKKSSGTRKHNKLADLVDLCFLIRAGVDVLKSFLPNIWRQLKLIGSRLDARTHRGGGNSWCINGNMERVREKKIWRKEEK